MYHVGFRHGVERTAAAHEEGVPARDDAAHAADDDDLRHRRRVHRFGHGIGRDETRAGLRCEDLRAGQHEAEGCSQDAAILDSRAGRDAPAPADHRAEGDDENILGAEHPVKG